MYKIQRKDNGFRERKRFVFFSEIGRPFALRYALLLSLFCVVRLILKFLRTSKFLSLNARSNCFVLINQICSYCLRLDTLEPFEGNGGLCGIKST